ncbi:hypothetical protein [Chryseobacterium gambrini]|uniref:Uncharacterized protein n=1 Tax=Chryseobacterium gambrini TaxID=373672 RepID=A0A1N7MPN2_9FLAO|nr:hypothetical protein [Chryseobacterium gambrini]SIS88010.1 hypothetical protein SAMN05421785_103384 [Chryseobacterium gambrini]
MKKTLLIGALFIAGIVSAFPFRTSCGTVIQVNDSGMGDMTYDQVIKTLKLMNGVVCGTTNVSITIYQH